MNSRPIICIADTDYRRLARIAVEDGAPRVVGSTDGFGAVVDALLRDAIASGVSTRTESVDDASIGVGFVPVASGDQRYLGALTAAFRGRGFAAQVFDETRAGIWRHLAALPPGADARRLLPVLDSIPDDEAAGLLAELDEIEREFESGAAEVRAGLRGFAKKEARLLKKFLPGGKE